ncbi:hypothetical protein HS088_TW14G00031 [Tripterygium wilfordii]|uniref:Uncharacterized protein n=1 Tax=Tripterygium wilfordii TaxID=458696 RepID=A0A7J7CP86_TRIWF|nr:protein IQ-DOMAIN 1 [Tripterygium wilfordii]KAF5735902.1 hypothetical protein HS088_TW14G00031 [Tripterygium wilfordii]
MGLSQVWQWQNILRRKFFRSSQTDQFVVLHPNPSSSPPEDSSTEATARSENFTHGTTPSSQQNVIAEEQNVITEEDIAAIKIQAVFRGHLARRAFSALRSLVKLQALARGLYVRKQSQIALHCMHALVRLQVRVRARQLLGICSDD